MDRYWRLGWLAGYNWLMTTINLQDLVRDPNMHFARVQAGESFVIVLNGHPIAELRSISAVGSDPRPVGLAAGAFTVPDDFDAPLPESIVREFEG
jgi:antitoxin (DNA-binding transcriptional repressor) of toxin-antitoxin stability system